MNIFEQAENLVSSYIIEKYFTVSGAKWKGKEYWTLSPLRDDKNIKSGTFSINENGLWCDLSNGEKGNFIQLVSAKFNLSKKEAAEKIISDCGNIPEEKKQKPSEVKKIKLPAIIPIKENKEINEQLEKIVTSRYWKDEAGEAKKIYNYRNIKNERYFAVCLFEKEQTETEKLENKKPVKQIIPFYYTEKGWKPGRPDIGKEKFPLLKSENLNKKENKNLPILIVEGEKCASIKVDGYVLVSWIGGTNSINKSDWSVLQDREIVIWPDYDDEGLKAATKIKSMLNNSEILDIEKALKQENKQKPETWDIADAKNDGITLENFIKNCPRKYDRETPGTPYEAFTIALSEIYGDGNIDQFDGLYYNYNDKKHFWEERLQINIESDIQQWIEKNHIEFLMMSETAIHTFITNTASFLKRYSTNYYKKNPFKDAALSPYIHFKNGVIKIEKDGFHFISREEKSECFFKNLYPTYCLDFNYDPELYKETDLQKTAPAFFYYIKSVLPDRIADDKKEIELEKTIDFYSQVIAYCINPEKRRPRFFAMYGNQDSGKSFLIDLLQEIIGEQFFLVRKTKDMDNRFAASDLWGTKIFVDDDVKSDLTLPDDFIKLYSGNKSVTIEKKNRDSIKGVKISVAMFFISNHMFSLSGGNEGISRRVIYMPYNKKIPKVDIYLLDKIVGKVKKGKESDKFVGKYIDERPAIIALALRGLKKLIDDDHEFIMPDWISTERKDWIRQSDTVQQFIEENLFINSSEYAFTKIEIFDKYKEFCADEGRKPYGKTKFYSKIKQFGGIQEHKNYGDVFEFPERKKQLKEKYENKTSDYEGSDDNDSEEIPFWLDA